MISSTRLRECHPYSARFPELRLVFANAREAYTGLRSNTPFGGMQEGYLREGTPLNRSIRGKVNQKGQTRGALRARKSLSVRIVKSSQRVQLVQSNRGYVPGLGHGFYLVNGYFLESDLNGKYGKQIALQQSFFTEKVVGMFIVFFSGKSGAIDPAKVPAHF